MRSYRTILPRAFLLALLLLPLSLARAQLGPRQSVTFSINQTTTVGKSVFLLGNLPELGNGDLRQAVKLDPTAYPTWRVTVSIPADRAYTYQFYLRDDAPGRTSDATNGTPIGTLASGSTSPAPMTPATKTIFLTWDVATPRLYWRQDGAAFQPVNMTLYGPGRASEQRWFAWGMGAAGKPIDFYFTDSNGGSRYPASGFYTTSMDGVFVQSGLLYSYVPAATVNTSRRDYTASNPPGLVSSNLGETRKYRVYLPRGYAQHTSRRYPVLYMHDGQNIFEAGAFGSWNAAPTLESLTNSGAIREIIVVGLDNGPNRICDYLPPDDTYTCGTGRADKYARFIRDEIKPIIDTQYRTIPDASVTGVMGSSMGGIVSLYLGYDFTPTFTRIGEMSGAWQFQNFYNRVKSTPAKPLRIYMDAGDSGTSNDNYWPTYNLRDALVGGSPAKYSIEGSLRFVIGYGQQHNEAAWSQRLPAALSYLYPAAEEPNDILRTVFNPTLDVNASGTVDIEDLYAQNQSPRDLNLDGAINSADTAFLEAFLRRGEITDMTGKRR